MGGKVIIFCAPSGSGKTTIVRRILAAHPDFSFSVSATTRSPRGTEQNGVDYFFLTVEEFRKRIADGEFLEFEEVYSGRLYGTLKSEVDRMWAAGFHALFDVDVKGGISIKNHFREKAISFFIQPPSLEILRERLTKRGTDSPEEIEKRLSKASYELTYAPSFDHLIVNDDLDRAVEEVEHLLNSFLASL